MQAEQFELPVVIVVGLSGAGKSTALQVFEDLRFVTADGLPPTMLDSMVGLLCGPDGDSLKGIALGVGQRRGAIATELDGALARIAAQGHKPYLMFLTADSHIILQRYATTRRPHPLERPGVGLEAAVLEEEALLAPVRAAADMLVDTSGFSIHDLRRAIQEQWSDASQHLRGMKVNIVTFGFKYGAPREADLVFDMRFLPNPFFEETLRPLTGQDSRVADYIFAGQEARIFKARFLDFMQYLLPLYDAEGRYRLSIAIGCTGGRHRSVAMALALEEVLGKAGYAVSVAHRHMELG